MLLPPPPPPPPPLDTTITQPPEKQTKNAEANARAEGYRKQAEDRQVTILTLRDELRRSGGAPRPEMGPLDSRKRDGGAELPLERENADLRAKLSELRVKLADVQSAQVSLRQAAHAAVGDERRKGAALLQEQLARLQGPEGFSLVKRENSDLRGRLSELRNQHADLRLQAQVAINAAEERARASEAGRAVAVDLGRRLQAQLSSLMGDSSELLLRGHQRQPFPVAPPPPRRRRRRRRRDGVCGGSGTSPPASRPAPREGVCAVYSGVGKHFDEYFSCRVGCSAPPS